jgi:hypothetical protein
MRTTILLAALLSLVGGCTVTSRLQARRAESPGLAKDFPKACTKHFDRALITLSELDLKPNEPDRAKGEIIANGTWGSLAVWLDPIESGTACRVRVAPSGEPFDKDYSAKFWEKYQPAE